MLKFGIIDSRTLAGAALVLFAATSMAQQTAPGAQNGGLIQQVQQKQAEIQQLNQQLAQIQEQTMEANPELADQRDELLASVDSKMEAAGHDPEASRERIGELQEQLESGELSTEDSQAVAEQMRQEQSTLQQAQGQAMQDEAIQSEVQGLNDNLIEAMREQDPQTEQLISQLQTVQQEYQALMQQAMEQQQGGTQPQGPGRD